MNIKMNIMGSLAALLFASTSQASLIVNSVDMTVAESTFGVTDDNTELDAKLNFQSAIEDDLVCELSLDILDNVGGRQLCGGPRRDTVTQFTISGVNTGTTELEFGLDWGRGGYSTLYPPAGGAIPVMEKYTDDIWWAFNWNHEDVLKFTFDFEGEFNLALLGFEGCCNGTNSARWRSANGEWQSLAVNAAAAVPVPSVLWLTVLGLAMLGRRKASGAGRVLEFARHTLRK